MATTHSATVRPYPLETEALIQLHDEAFRYFGGVTEECRLSRPRLRGLRPREQSKVEAGVKYVKQDALYGERFDSETALRQHLQHWLESVANARTHGTTGREPRAHFELEERAQLRPYQVPTSVSPSWSKPLLSTYRHRPPRLCVVCLSLPRRESTKINRWPSMN